MSSSGTVGSTIYRVSDLSDSISRRCGVQPENLTPEGLDVITGTMWRTLAAWSNRGINLWRLYHRVVPIYNGQQIYQLAQGDIDLMQVVQRLPLRLAPAAVTSSGGGTTPNLSDGDLTTSCTQGAPNGSLVFDWGSNVTQQVGLVGINSVGATSYNLTFASSADGITYRTVLTPGAVAYTAGGWNWYEIDPAGAPARYFRITEGGGATISFNEVLIAQDWNDLEITRWNLDQWSLNPNKRGRGSPRQYYIERLLTPQISIWPTPDTTQDMTCMCWWIHRHIEDVGVMSNTLDIPQRWYSPLVDMCSYLALPELPKADLARYQMLKDIAMGITLPDAEKEERDKGPITLTPNIGVYTK